MHKTNFMNILKQKLTFLLLIIFLLSSCIGSTNSSDNSYDDEDEESYDSSYDDEDEESYEEESTGIEDGTYSADVEYYNPETGYSNSYTLDVEVQDNNVVEIDFNNGGYLDDSHIDPAELDEDGNCTVYDDEGREYEIHIDY